MYDMDNSLGDMLAVVVGYARITTLVSLECVVGAPCAQGQFWLGPTESGRSISFIGDRRHNRHPIDRSASILRVCLHSNLWWDRLLELYFGKDRIFRLESLYIIIIINRNGGIPQRQLHK